MWCTKCLQISVVGIKPSDVPIQFQGVFFQSAFRKSHRGRGVDLISGVLIPIIKSMGLCSLCGTFSRTPLIMCRRPPASLLLLAFYFIFSQAVLLVSEFENPWSRFRVWFSVCLYLLLVCITFFLKISLASFQEMVMLHDESRYFILVQENLYFALLRYFPLENLKLSCLPLYRSFYKHFVNNLPSISFGQTVCNDFYDPDI